MSNIPVLPVVVKPMKDAARAAKVSVRWAMHRIKEVTISYLLDLPQFIVTGYWLERRGEQEIVHLYGMHREEVAMCPRCHQVSMTYHDGKEHCVRDLDVWGSGLRAGSPTYPRRNAKPSVRSVSGRSKRPHTRPHWMEWGLVLPRA